MAPERTAAVFPRRSDRGSITLVALCLTTALGIALGSYLALCTRSAQFSARTLNLDRAQQLAQVGMEEALWALNQGSWSSSGASGSAAWTTSGADRTVTLPYTLTGPDMSAQVVLTVANFAGTGPTWPTITSHAIVTLPSGQIFTKKLQATLGPAPLFGNAIASSESYVSFAEGGTVDSWNSDPDTSDATAAVAYAFTAGNAANYAAVISGYGNGTYGVILTQATVCGYVSTFGLPVSYSTSGSPAASVKGPATAALLNVDTTRLGKSAFVPAAATFRVLTPANAAGGLGGLLGALGTLVNTLLGAPTGSEIYFNNDLTLDGSLLSILLGGGSSNLRITNSVKLIVNGDLTIRNTGEIVVAATGALQIFVNGDVTIGGNGIDNQTHEPKKLAIFCTGSSTSDAVTYNTARDFYGVIYSENKPIDIQRNATFYGALLSRQYVRFSGSATNPQFHYDSALRQVRFSGVRTPYLIKTISEL